jgi:DNA repair protein RadA/Sms
LKAFRCPHPAILGIIIKDFMVTANNSIFICSNCDAQSPKWSGRCLECGAWGTLIETSKQVVKAKSQKNNLTEAGKLIELNKIEDIKLEKLKSGLHGFDLVLGGGFIQGSLILLGGDPGVGKSTLALQIINNLSVNQPCLYFSAEESADQVAGRLKRLDNHQAGKLHFLHEDNVDVITATIEKHKPAIAVVDSIQTIYSSDLPSEAGSVNQVRACTVKLLSVAKQFKTSIIIIGHVTKEGLVAGPKTMEHLVDVVLYLEGEKYKQFRLLRSVKNRFAQVGEVAVWEMAKEGLKEVLNPSEAFLAGMSNRPGSAIVALAEGTQVFLVEVQALVSKTTFGYPKRSSFGFDQRRLELLCTILTKRGDVNLSNFDVYLNIVGGLILKEPAVDLAVAAAIISSWQDKANDRSTVFFGEIGLNGEVRTVAKTKDRVKAALKLGFKKIVLADFAGEQKDLNLIKIKEVKDLLKLFNKP